MTATDPEAARLDASDIPPPGRSVWGLIGRGAAGLLITAWCLFLFAWLALYGLLLPRVAAWKPEIETQAGRLLGVTVRIGGIEVPSSGWVPALHLSDVVLLDAQGRTALRLPRVSASLSPRSLLSLQPHFEQLLIEGAALEVRRDAQGRFKVAGLSLDAAEGGADTGEFDATDWLLAQGEFAIRGAQVRWIDETRSAGALVLRDVDFVMRNGLRRHDWRLDATPPEGFGGRWTLRGRFRQGLFSARSDWKTWSGEVYALLPETDVAAWRPHVDLPRELRSGKGAARVWIDVEKGRLRGATADVLLSGVALRWPGVQQTMAFERLEGRVLARQDRESVTLGLEQLSFETGQGLVWPASDMKLVLRHEPIRARALSKPASRPAEPVTASLDDEPAAGLPLFELLTERQIVGGEFSAARLDLALMSSIAQRAPLGAVLHQGLREWNPRGVIEDMKARWEGPPDRPLRYRIGGRLADLALQAGVVPPSQNPAAHPVLGRPGITGARVVLEATEAGGQADVEIRSGTLSFPGFFEDPVVDLEALESRLTWQWRPDAELEVTLARTVLRNPDLTGEVQASWRGSWAADARGLGHLDLTASIPQARADRLWRYLPAAAPADTRGYLRKAVRGGQLQDVGLRIRGELDEFPFAQPGAQGDFRVTGRWRDGTFLYLPAEEGYPAWPEVARLDARLRFDGQRLDFTDARGRVFGVDLNRGVGRIDLMNPSVPLTLDVQARGPGQDLIRYVKATPIDRWLDGALSAAVVGGPAGLGLRLELPLLGTEPARLRGSIQFNGNEIQVTPSLPPLTAARGRLEFSERGFSLAGASGQLLGGEVSLEGGLQPSSGLRVSLQGTASAAALREAPQLQELEALWRRLEGQAPYRVQISQLDRQLSWTLTSPLTGLGIDLPAPLRKAPDAASAGGPLRLQVTGPGPSRPEAERIELQLGRLVQAQAWRESGGARRLLQAAVGIGTEEVPALPARGVALTVVQDRLDADAWLAALDDEGTRPAPARGAGGGRPELMPQTVKLRVGELIALGRRLDRVDATLTPLAPAGSGWRAELSATQLVGRIDWKPGVAGAQDRVVARLSRLSVPATRGDILEPVVDDGRIRWPALDVVAEAFELRGRPLGRLEIEADVRDGGRDWRLQRLRLQHPHATLSASGSWAPPAGARAGSPRETTLDLRLDLRNAGDLLSQLGYAEALKGARGPVRGVVSWQGSPLAPDIRSMRGRLRLDVQDGQFLKADPGAARLLGVLSLQSLPRRLVLDFRDVFQEGFPFDTLDGDVEVQAGVARTRNLRMRGLQAAVLMDGSADLLKETQDLRVLVIPEINAGTASLAYATVNPALGLGTFLAQLFLRRPLMAANTREFQISGAWVDPKVERVLRSAPLSADDIERAAAALSAPATAPAAASAAMPALPPASSPRIPMPSTTPPTTSRP